jgi:hypothetical protein
MPYNSTSNLRTGRSSIVILTSVLPVDSLIEPLKVRTNWDFNGLLAMPILLRLP